MVLQVACWGLVAAAILLGARFFVPAPSRAEPKSRPQITIGAITYTAAKDAGMQLLLNHLSQELNAECDLVNQKDFTQVLAMLKNKQIQFAITNPLDYAQAHRLLGAEAVAVMINSEGKSVVNAILVTKKSSGIKTLDQAKGKSLGFVHADSLTGFKVQVYCLLKERNQPISVLFPENVFTGSHLKVVDGLAKGLFVVGATNSKDLKESCAALGLDPNQFNAIWKSDFLPETLIVAGPELPLELKNSFAQALFSFSRNKQGCKELKIRGFARPKDSYFTLIKELDAYLQKGKIVY